MQTARAVENFPISGLRAPADLVTATILIKKAAADVNAVLGRLDAEVARAIVAAADEILSGKLRDQFVVDVYSGRRRHVAQHERERSAGESSGRDSRRRPRHATRVHPNDHVNMGQSTNDVFPTATRLALLLGAGPLVAAARGLADSLARKGDEFVDVLKTGRTHLQDAVPITLGQEFSGYAECVRRGAEDVAQGAVQLEELNIGATAVGTSLNAGDELPQAGGRGARARHRSAAEACPESLPGDAEHGRRASHARARCAGSPSKSAKSRATFAC